MDTETVEKAMSNVVRIDVRFDDHSSNGSGLLLDNKGTILTCDHVVHPPAVQVKDISVVKHNEMPKSVEIIKSDPLHDLTIIKAKDLKVVGELNYMGYEQTKVGQPCFVLGYPLSLPHLTLAAATISAKGKVLQKEFPFDLFQIDCRVNGDS